MTKHDYADARLTADASKREASLRNLEEGLALRKTVLSELRAENERSAAKAASVKEDTRKVDLDIVQSEFSRKKAYREWEAVDDTIAQLKRENARKFEILRTTQEQSKELEAKRKKIQAEFAQVQEFHLEVGLAD